MLTWCPKGGLPFVDRVGANRRRASSEAWRATVPEWKAVKRLWDRTTGRGGARNRGPSSHGRVVLGRGVAQSVLSCVVVRPRAGARLAVPVQTRTCALRGGRRSRGRHSNLEARVFEHVLCRSAGAAVRSSGTVSVDPAGGDEGWPVAQSVRRFGRFRCHGSVLGTRLST
jgi:hypothetical protein